MIADIDRALLCTDVKTWLATEGLTLRGAAGRFDGVNAAMLSRACNGHVLSAGSLLALCHAMDRDPRRYLVFVDPIQRNQAVTAIVQRETEGQYP